AWLNLGWAKSSRCVTEILRTLQEVASPKLGALASFSAPWRVSGQSLRNCRRRAPQRAAEPRQPHYSTAIFSVIRPSGCKILAWQLLATNQRSIFGMTCEKVQRELSNYLDRELPVEVCTEMENHFHTCKLCATLLQDTRDIVLALGDERLVDVPPGYSTRLYRKLNVQLRGSGSSFADKVSWEIPLGITDDVVDLGSHLIYFWQSDDEFAQGVRFLEPGLLGEDHCVVFGHDEATERVFRLLQVKGFDTESLTKQRRITLLRRESPAGTTLSDIEDVFKAAIRAGAPAIRYLGNLGFGEAPLPGKGIEDVLELEARVTSL